MTDHIIPLPPNFTYVNQFQPSTWAPHPSLYRCVTATMAMLAEIAYPGKWNPPQLEDQLYTRFAGPDVPSDEQGLTKANVLKWFGEVNIGFVDLQPLIGGINEELLAEIEAQNKQGVPQLIVVADESKLYDARTGAKLHNWVDTGMHHCFMRAGFSDSDGYGLYYEPAAPGFAQPVPIAWRGDNSIVSAGIMTAIAVMPHGVAVPPANFSYQTGTWPTPKPAFDAAKALNTIAVMVQGYDAMKVAMLNLGNDISVLKTEV